MRIPSPQTQTENRRPTPSGFGPWTLDLGLSASRAFTLLETVGVMAVIAILAAVIVPVVIKRVDFAAYSAEQANLGNFTNALTQQILLNKNIPSQAAWSSAVANWLSLPLSSITNNARRNTRAYLIDTGGWLTAAGYTQTTNGTTAATSSARVMFVSSIGSALPASLVSSTPISATDFNNLWNSAAGVVPATGPWSGWTGKPTDVLVQRLNLQPLFYQVILNNFDPSYPGTAFFTVDTNISVYMPVSTNGPGWMSYYLDGTVLGLNSNTIPQIRYTLKRNTSFVYENGYWLGQILNGRPASLTGSNDLPSAFVAKAIDFFNADLNPTTANKGGGSQGVVLNAMGSLMYDYTTWALMDFARGTAAGKKAKKDAMVKLLKDGDMKALEKSLSKDDGGLLVVP